MVDTIIYMCDGRAIPFPSESDTFEKIKIKECEHNGIRIVWCKPFSESNTEWSIDYYAEYPKDYFDFIVRRFFGIREDYGEKYRLHNEDSVL